MINHHLEKIIKSLLIQSKELICNYNLYDAVKRGDIQTVEILISLGVNLRIAFKIAIIKDSIQERLVKFEDINLKEKVIEEIYKQDIPINNCEQYHLYRILFNETNLEFPLGILTSIALPYDYYELLSGIKHFNFKYYNLKKKDIYFKMLKLMLENNSKEAFCKYDMFSFKNIVVNCVSEVFDTAEKYAKLFNNKRCYDLLMKYKN